MIKSAEAWVKLCVTFFIDVDQTHPQPHVQEHCGGCGTAGEAAAPGDTDVPRGVLRQRAPDVV